MERMEYHRAWYEKGKADGATHVVIYADRNDEQGMTEAAVWVRKGQDPIQTAAQFAELDAGNNPTRPKGGFKVVAIYDISRDLEEQLKSTRSFFV